MVRVRVKVKSRLHKWRRILPTHPGPTDYPYPWGFKLPAIRISFILHISPRYETGVMELLYNRLHVWSVSLSQTLILATHGQFSGESFAEQCLGPVAAILTGNGVFWNSDVKKGFHHSSVKSTITLNLGQPPGVSCRCLLVFDVNYDGHGGRLGPADVTWKRQEFFGTFKLNLCGVQVGTHEVSLSTSKHSQNISALTFYL